jgi:uncharacterized membrane protein HdeD (DUF308 family)
VLLLALLFIVVGIVLLVAVAHPHADAAGWILVLIGLILLVLAVVGTEDIDVEEGVVLTLPFLSRLPRLH